MFFNKNHIKKKINNARTRIMYKKNYGKVTELRIVL